MNESFRPAALSAGAIQPEAFGLSETPMSAARLAAEAAFAGPRSPVSEPVRALVTVRRARLALPPQAAAAGAAEPAAPAAKVQRVFRIDAPREPPPQGPLPGPSAAEPVAAATPRAAEAAAPAPPPAVVRRRRRADPDKRPGPVLHVVVDLPPPPAAPAAPLQAAQLMEALDALDPLLQDIARAQAWRFDGSAFQAEWQRLSQQLDALRAELHAHAQRHRPGFEDYQVQL